jgi:hypothetical protein
LIETGVVGDMGRGVPGIEIVMDREGSEKEEEGKGYPGTPSGLFHQDRKSPEAKEGEQKEDRSLGMEWEVKMA